MKFLVTDIAIDWQDDFEWIDPISSDKRAEIKDEIIGTVWEADNEDDLVYELIAAHGWSIETVDYKILLTGVS